MRKPLAKHTVCDAFIPLVRPCIGSEEKEAVLACLDSGWVTTGPRTQQLQEALSKRCGAPYTLALGSATAGLYLTLKALGVGPGDEVITTPLTFAATANVIEAVGAKTIFVDVCAETLNIDPHAVERAITQRTKVIMPVHLAGVAADMERLNALARTHHLRVIEDAAHAIGTTVNGRPVGSYGDIQVFSFHANKNITTLEGGAIALRDQALFEKLLPLHFHGMDRLAWDRHQKTGKPFYDIVVPGLKFNMTDVQAAVGICQLSKLDAFNQRRQVLAQRYQRALKDCAHLKLPYDLPGRAWHVYAPLLRLDTLVCDRDEIAARLKALHIGTGVHFRPLHLTSYYRRAYQHTVEDFPVAEAAGSTLMSLPLFPELQEAQQDRVIESLQEVLHDCAR